MSLDNLQDLYVEQLQDLHSAENQILQALPLMAQRASHTELKSAFELHEQQTREQVKRLEQIADSLGVKAKGEKCKGMEGLLKEGQKVMKEKGDDSVRDAAMIAAAQRVEHYEIAGYGCARTYARLLGREQDAALLQRTLDEEGNTDQKLSGLAERVVNMDAMRAD